MSPSVVFKYHRIDKNLIDSLIKGYFYCAQLAQLNDPLDCRVGLLGVIERAIEKSEGKARENLRRLRASSDFLDSIAKKVAEVGVCSFSQNMLRPMMWSHYADKHKGVCLLFRIPDSFVSYDKNKIIGAASVQYGDNVVTNALLDIAEDLSGMDAVSILRSVVVPLLTAKGVDWDVEQEWRLIRDVPGELQYDRSCLTQICFGIDASDRDKDLINDLVNRCEFKVQFCEIRRSDTDFALRAVEL